MTMEKRGVVATEAEKKAHEKIAKELPPKPDTKMQDNLKGKKNETKPKEKK